MPIIREESDVIEHKCSKCGHREPVRKYVFPSASLVIRGNERKFVVNIDGKDHEFAKEPSKSDIKALLDKQQIAKVDGRTRPAKADAAEVKE